MLSKEQKRQIEILAQLLFENKPLPEEFEKEVTVIIPAGELLDRLAGFAWGWRLSGLWDPKDVRPLTGREGLSAQGLEGCYHMSMPLKDALLVASQVPGNRITIKNK